MSDAGTDAAVDAGTETALEFSRYFIDWNAVPPNGPVYPPPCDWWPTFAYGALWALVAVLVVMALGRIARDERKDTTP